MRVLVLSACALAALSCQRSQIHQVLPPGARIDVFPQVARAQLDALFVVDNSQYMGVQQKRVADSFHRFVEYLALNQIDWHLGLTSSDVDADATKGIYQGGGQKQYFASTDDNVAANVGQAVIALGTHGSAISAVLQQADLALHGAPDGFLRDGAALFVVLVTDNNDRWSTGEDLYYYRSFKQSKGPGNDGLVRLSAVAGPVPDGCKIPDPTNPSGTFVAEAAPRLKNLALQTGGGFHSLCDPAFDQVFDQLGATAAGLKRAFRLARTPDPASLVVHVRAPCDISRAALANCTAVSDECSETVPGLVCTPPNAATDGWVYDGATNSLLFDGKAIPPRGSSVEAQYKEPGQ